jgi:CHAT domain-containing protein/Tfp pilus assembly protein PilF
MLNARSHLKAQLRLFREAETDSREVLRLLESEPAHDETWVFQVKMGALTSLMWIYRTLGEYPLAIEHARRIVEEGKQRGDSIDWQLGDLAELHAQIGDLRSAEEYLQRAVRGPSYHPQFHPSFVRLARLHLSFQLYEEAIRDLDEFEKSFKDSFKKDFYARRNNVFLTTRRELLTEIWLRLGQPEKALQTVQEIREEEQNTGMARGILGMVLMALGRDAEAERYFLVRLASSKDANWRQKELDALLNLGKICRNQKRPAEASRYFERALELCRQLGHRGDETAVLLEMSELAQETNQVRSAEEMARQALALSSEVQDQQSLWSAQYRLAQVALAQGQKQAAIEHLEGAVKAVEAVSGNIKVDLFKIGFLENKVHIFDELISLLAPTDPARAFHYAERRRAQAFLESRQQAGLLQDGNVRGDLGKRRDDLRGRLIGKQKALLEQFSKPAAERNLKLIGSLQSELAEIREAHTQAMKEIEVASAGKTAALTRASVLSAEQVQLKTLRPNQALLEYVVQDNESFVFLVTPQSCKSFRLNIGRKQLTDRVERLLLPFSQLREGQVDLLHVNYDVRLSHELYRLLFRPIEREIPRGIQLVIVADDVLNYLPFESLARTPVLGPKHADLPYAEYQGVDWLVKHYTFSYAVSASSLSLRHEPDRSSPSHLLAFGNPSLRGPQRSQAAQVVLRRISEASTEVPELVSLPQATRETQRIGQLMTGKVQSRVLVGEQATEAEFSKQGPAADYLHFAVHSLVNQQQPYYSALVLAPDANSDGLLQTYEIVNTPLRSRLVTLSGCETALGKLKRGEGMLGLQRAFLQAGAESVVVSLWSIEDSTADFMEGFYRNIRRDQSIAAALRNAKQQYLKGTVALGGGQRISSSHPFFWAPFVLTTTRMP